MLERALTLILTSPRQWAQALVWGAVLAMVPSLAKAGTPTDSKPTIAFQMPAFDTSRIALTANIVYARHPRAESLYTTYDIYTPATPQKQLWPVVVYIHGGFWKSGSKGTVGHKPNWFIENGFIFVSVNYRLSIDKPGDSARFAHNVKHPKHTEDIALALADLRKRIGAFGGDSAAVFLMGHSAGGHLASLVALNPRFLDDVGFSRENLRGIVALDPGIIDMPWAYAHASPVAKANYRNAFGEKAAFNLDASPLAHASPNRRHPPFMLVHVRDYSYQQGLKLAHHLQIAQSHASLIFEPRKDHGALDTDFAAPGDEVGMNLAEAVTRWMASHLAQWIPPLRPAHQNDARSAAVSTPVRTR